ncbi:hypothetical protein Q75_11975, partial [Bacillus coahuilensis p1.1.43]
IKPKGKPPTRGKIKPIPKWEIKKIPTRIEIEPSEEKKAPTYKRNPPTSKGTSPGAVKRAC